MCYVCMACCVGLDIGSSTVIPVHIAATAQTCGPQLHAPMHTLHVPAASTAAMPHPAASCVHHDPLAEVPRVVSGGLCRPDTVRCCHPVTAACCRPRGMCMILTCVAGLQCVLHATRSRSLHPRARPAEPKPVCAAAGQRLCPATPAAFT